MDCIKMTVPTKTTLFTSRGHHLASEGLLLPHQQQLLAFYLVSQFSAVLTSVPKEVDVKVVGYFAESGLYEMVATLSSLTNAQMIVPRDCLGYGYRQSLAVDTDTIPFADFPERKAGPIPYVVKYPHGVSLYHHVDPVEQYLLNTITKGKLAHYGIALPVIAEVVRYCLGDTGKLYYIVKFHNGLLLPLALSGLREPTPLQLEVWEKRQEA